MSFLSIGIRVLAGLLLASAAWADEVKLPVDSDDKGSVYVAPKLSPTETSMHTQGATVGVERKDGSGVYGGMDTSSERPSYSVGGSTGGNVSLTGGVESDGKEKHGVKAGVRIRY